MLISPAQAIALPVSDLALFQAPVPRPMLPGAALLMRRRRKSGWAGMAAGSLLATRATVRRAQHQFCRVVLGRSEVASTLPMRSARDGWSGAAKALRETCFGAMLCLVMSADDNSTNSL